MLALVAESDIETAWPTCLPHVQRAIDRSAGQLTGDTVLDALRAGVFQLWQDLDGATPVVAVTGVTEHAASATLAIVLIGGRGLATWVDHVEATLAEYARSRGCSALEAYVRPGLIGARYQPHRAALHGWRPHWTLVRKELEALPGGSGDRYPGHEETSTTTEASQMGSVVNGIGDIMKSVVPSVAKVLGKDADMPKELKALDTIGKSTEGDVKSFADSLSGISKEIATLNKSVSKLTGALDGAIAAVDKDDFGLDPKKPDDKKKIEAAKKTLLGALGNVKKDLDTQVTSFSKLDSVIASAGKSKGLA